MRGQPQLPHPPAALSADVLQAVRDLRNALRTQRDIERAYANESRSPWRRATTLSQLDCSISKAIAKTGEARGSLDAVLLGEDA